MINNYFKSNFAKNVLALASGTTIAQAIPILASIFLTRLYTPEEFGMLAVLMSIVAICSSIVNAKYELAIMLPEKDIEALSILKLCLFISVTVSLILFLLVLLFKFQIARWVREPDIENWLFFVPFSVLFIGIYNGLNFYNIRLEKYRNVSISAVAKSTGLVSTQIGFGLWISGPFGLIIGQLSSYFFGNSIMLKALKGKWNILYTIPLSRVKQMAKRFVKFPKFSMPSTLLNTATLNSTNLIITALFSTHILGLYSLSTRVLGSPSLILGRSISNVYFQQASKLRGHGEKITPLFYSVMLKLVAISVPVYTFLYFIVEWLFGFVFGQNWILAGTYCKIIIPLMCVRFVSSSLSNTLTVVEKQEYALMINFALFVATITIFLTTNYFGLSFVDTLHIYSVVLSSLYGIFLFVYYKLSKSC